MPDPTLSICIPTYNRAAYLREAIASVLAQEGVRFEVIVSDNASTDNTTEVVREFKDASIRYHRSSQNLGPFPNGRKCYELATGKYITWLFDDDQMLPGSLAKKVEVLDLNPHVGMVHSHCVVVDQHGEPLPSQWPMLYDRNRTSEGKAFFMELIASNNLVAFPTVVVRKCCLDEVGFFSSRLGFSNDFEMWMRVALHYDVAYLAEPTIKYRIHPGQDTNNFAGTLKGVQDLFEAKRLVLDKYRELIPNHRQLRRSIALRHFAEARDLGRQLLSARKFFKATSCFAYAFKLNPRRFRWAARASAKALLGPLGTHTQDT
jgi:glycosyltransferase involved in cell wall biosynthesis